MIKPSLIIPLVLLGVFLIAAGYAFNSGGIDKLIEGQNEYSCEVAIANPIILSSRIQSIDCKLIGKCIPAFQINKYGIFKDAINVRAVTADGWSDSQSSDVWESTYKTFTFKPCTGSKQVSFTVFSDNERADSREVTVA